MTTHKAPTVTVREITEADVPPVPDKEAIRAWLDRKGAGATPLGANAGHYQHIVLNTRTGELSFHCSDYRRRDNEEDYYPGSLFAPSHWQGVPEVLYWVIDSGVDERPYHDVAEGNAFAHEVAPLAQTLLDHLVPVPGTEDLDWSAVSASAGLDIGRACHRDRKGPEGRRPWLIEVSDAARDFPRIIQDHVATATNATVDNEAEHLVRMGLRRQGDFWPDLATHYGIEEQDATRYHAGLIGTRAYLYQHRLDQAAGRPLVPAAEWLDKHPTVVTADTTDAELEAFPQTARAAAAAEGIVLLGASRQAAYERRTALRQEVLDELAALGKARAEAEQTVKSARAGIYSRLYRAFAWEGRPETSDAELGRLAQMTRQAVNKLREPLDDAPTTEEETVRA
ncbi:hypothetical protein [Streptomyces sp. NPDC006134]|uniref:hypothetical protein n=1 Tax=Streptomyces sp. NPDC006134 TaxID=3154467 RepID=UPI0033E58D2E